jgi:hypothetical protein
MSIGTKTRSLYAAHTGENTGIVAHSRERVIEPQMEALSRGKLGEGE